MYHKIPDQIRGIILKSLCENLSLQEIEKLDGWTRKSPENKAVASRICKKEYLEKQLDVFKEIKTESKDLKLDNTSSKAFFWYKKHLKYAASIVVLLGFASMAVYFKTALFPKNEIAQKAPENICPGSSKALLILDDGTNLSLTKQQNDTLSADNLHIVNDHKQLSYANATQKEKTAEKIKWHTLKIPKGGEYQLEFDDGTRVWLNSDSELKYPVSFHNLKQRTVFLKGEAYFDVATKSGKSFVVKSFFQQIKVYGTEFNVNTYDENQVETVLVEGEIGIRHQNKPEIKILPGQLVRTHKKTGRIDVEKVSTRSYTAWKDGDFVFENETLESIMLHIERWYDVKIFYQDEACKTFRFTGDIERYSDIRKLLYFIENTSDAKFKINPKEKTIVVMTNC